MQTQSAGSAQDSGGNAERALSRLLTKRRGMEQCFRFVLNQLLVLLLQGIQA